MEFTTMTVGGIKGPTWKCDDLSEALGLAKEHGYDVLDIVEAEEPESLYLVVAG
jgi:hypothetical protein